MKNKYSAIDKFAMERALLLAAKVKGKTGDNPAVGAVIYDSQGNIVGEGYTHKPGADHAEKDAIKKGGKFTQGASMAVTLEPCRHYGRTAPCTTAIIKAGIKKVVVATKDPNPLMAGKGIMDLKNSGIEVIYGLDKEKATEINADFFKYITTKRPYIALKTAITMNGLIAADSGDSKWITSFGSRQKVHKLRSQFDSVLVGMNTVIMDDPELTVRHCAGRNPVRIIISGKRDLPYKSKIMQSADKVRTILITAKTVRNRREDSVERIVIPSSSGKIAIDQLLKTIAGLGIKGVLVEGGQGIQSAFLSQQAVDFIYLFMAPRLLLSGREWLTGKATKSMGEAYSLKEMKVEKIGSDWLFTGKPLF